MNAFAGDDNIENNFLKNYFPNMTNQIRFDHFYNYKKFNSYLNFKKQLIYINK